MQYRIFRIIESTNISRPGEEYISFKKFSEFLEDKLKTSDDLKAKYYRFVLKHLKRNAELLSNVHINELGKYEYIFQLLESIVLPHLADEKEIALGLGVPMNGVFFFSTKAFYDLIQEKLTDYEVADAAGEEEAFIHNRKKMSYALILDRFYNFKPFIKEELVRVYTHKTTGITRYFNIDIDNRFVEVSNNALLPEINVNEVQQLLADKQSMPALENMLPLTQFSFSGFSVVNVTDITPRYALHKMRSAIIKHDESGFDKTYSNIIQLLAQLCGTQDVTFGLLPFLKLNNRLVSYYKNYSHSIIVNISKKNQIPEATFLNWINICFKNPELIVRKECNGENKNTDELCNKLSKEGINAYSLIPVYYANEAAGVLEVATKNNNSLNETLFNRLDAALPIVAQLMHQSQSEFSASITKVIRTNFTAIQPSVLWKFNEVAWNYIKNPGTDALHKMEEIRFENVNPLYGAVDIRNSTIERNHALQKDMRQYFLLVKDVLSRLDVTDKARAGKLLDEANIFATQIETIFTGNEESALDVLMGKISGYLDEVKETGHQNKNLIKKYFKETELKNGKAFTHRRILENSMQYINFNITNCLEQMQIELQEKYPVYFEKIRTDGIEYDIYLGESIAPNEPYKKTFLNEIRLMQLRYMAAIAKLIHTSAKTLPVHLQTTQLIYINASSIDITFRMDEKRFDVEGGYNIRYHIVKKRIDKVHILHTDERLTQPGKIAIIYTQPQLKKEYMQYIKQLQQQHILEQDVEMLELEELQGVTGLKALRVAVVMN